MHPPAVGGCSRDNTAPALSRPLMPDCPGNQDCPLHVPVSEVERDRVRRGTADLAQARPACKAQVWQSHDQLPSNKRSRRDRECHTGSTDYGPHEERRNGKHDHGKTDVADTVRKRSKDDAVPHESSEGDESRSQNGEEDGDSRPVTELRSWFGWLTPWRLIGLFGTRPSQIEVASRAKRGGCRNPGGTVGTRHLTHDNLRSIPPPV